MKPDDIPRVQQRSVEELIDQNLLEHNRGMFEIMDRFQNTVIVEPWRSTQATSRGRPKRCK